MSFFIMLSISSLVATVSVTSRAILEDSDDIFLVVEVLCYGERAGSFKLYTQFDLVDIVLDFFDHCVDFSFYEGIDTILISLCISIVLQGGGDQGAKVHRGCSWVLPHNRKMYHSVGGCRRNVVCSTNGKMLHSRNELMGLDSRGLGLRRKSLHKSINRCSCRLVRLRCCSCVIFLEMALIAKNIGVGGPSKVP
jgi:hypothetical protein